MPCSAGHWCTNIGLFHTTLIKILERKTLRLKSGSSFCAPFAEWGLCTDLTYMCVVSTVVCVAFLLGLKFVSFASDISLYLLCDFTGGDVQCLEHSCVVLFHNLLTVTGVPDHGGCVMFHPCEDFLLKCGDVESNPGPRQSPRLHSDTDISEPPASSTPTPEPSDQDIFDSVRSMLREPFPPTRGETTATAASQSTPPPEEPGPGDLTSLLQSLNSKFDAMKTDLDKLTSVCSRIQREINDLTNKMEDVRRESEETRKENCELKDRIQTLENKTEMLERQTKRNNLIFYGVDRKENETRLDCENAVRDVMTTKLGLSEDTQVDNVHRVNKRANSPIVATFPSYSKRSDVLKSRQKLQGTGIFISEDFTVRVQAIRKKLLPFMKDAKKAGKKVRLVYEHLYIDGVKNFLGPDGLRSERE